MELMFLGVAATDLSPSWRRESERESEMLFETREKNCIFGSAETFISKQFTDILEEQDT